MPAFRKLAVAAVLMAAPAPALAQGWCAALDRIAAAAREPAPFASLREAEANGAVLVPGYRVGACRVTVGHEVACWRNLAPESLEVAAVEAALRDCLGTALVPDPSGPDPGRSRAVAFLAGGLRYRAGANCTQYCRAGLITSFRVTLVRRDP